MKANIFLGIILSASFLMPVSVYPLDTGKIYAYPVPFNPKKGVLTVRSENALTLSSVKMTVYDINGDKVFSRTYAAMDTAGLKWSGRNSKGNYVKPGLYILKLVLEDDSTGGYKKELIRVLVRY